MSDYISRLFQYLSKIFKKEKQRPELIEVPASRYSTPLRAPVHGIAARNSRNTDRRGCRLTSLPSRLSNSFTQIRSSSEIPLMRSISESSVTTPFTPFKPTGNLHKFGSNLIMRKGANELNDYIHQQMMNQSMNNSVPECDQVPSYEELQSTLDFHPVAEDYLDMMSISKTSSDCCGKWATPSVKKHRLRSNPGPFSDNFLKPKQNLSKIPIRADQEPYSVPPNPVDMFRRPARQRGKHTLTTARNNSVETSDSQEIGDAGDNLFLKSFDISNWITYRNDTSKKFERMFKYLTKKKHTTGNIIDAAIHSQWMQLAGITIDKDATIFKHFAGGKVVLTFGEYKFLIEKICSIKDMDYWDVLRKMATFQDGELHPQGAWKP